MNCVKYETNLVSFNLLRHRPVKYSHLRLLLTFTPRISSQPLTPLKTSKFHIECQNNVFLSNNYFFYSTALFKNTARTSPLEPVVIKSELEKYEWAQDLLFDIDSVPMDRDVALSYSNRILDDPISYLTVEESSKFILPVPNSDLSKVYDLLTRPFKIYFYYPSVVVMFYLILERVENEELTKIFDIGEGFNKRIYFLTLHVWLIIRRNFKEIPEGYVLYRQFRNVYNELLKDWIYRRGTPEMEFKKQYHYTRTHMMKFIYELNKCTMDGDLYPYRLAVTIKRVMYEDSVSDETVDLLVKYLIRQFLHLSNLDKDCFLGAHFLWADTEEICKPARLLKRPMYQLIKYLGYKGVREDDRIRRVGPNAESLSRSPIARLGALIRNYLARPSSPQISKVDKIM